MCLVVCGGVKNNFQKKSYRKERLRVHCLHSMHAGEFKAWVCPGCHRGILFLATTTRTQSALRVDARLVCTLTQVCYVDFMYFRMYSTSNKIKIVRGKGSSSYYSQEAMQYGWWNGARTLLAVAVVLAARCPLTRNTEGRCADCTLQFSYISLTSVTSSTPLSLHCSSFARGLNTGSHVYYARGFTLPIQKFSPVFTRPAMGLLTSFVVSSLVIARNSNCTKPTK